MKKEKFVVFSGLFLIAIAAIALTFKDEIKNIDFVRVTLNSSQEDEVKPGADGLYVTFIYKNGEIFPLVGVKNGSFVEPYQGQDGFDKFQSQYFTKNNKYIFTDAHGYRVGLLQVDDKGKKPDFTQCSYEELQTEEISIKAKEARLWKDTDTSSGIATNFIPLKSEPYREQSKVTFNPDQVISAVQDRFLQTLNERMESGPEMDNLMKNIKVVDTAFADIDNDGDKELYAVLTSRYDIKNEYGYLSWSYVFVAVLEQTPTQQLNLIHYYVSGGGEVDSTGLLALYGLVDINNDGIKELIYSTIHYEWSQVNILSIQNGQLKIYRRPTNGCPGSL